VQRDQESKAYGENDERNEEVTIGQDGAKFLDFSHCVSSSDWRNHKEM